MLDINSISTGLALSDDEIWYSSACESISYPPCAHYNCCGLEDNSFWFRHRNECIIAAVRSFPPGNAGPIFDVGGGNGFVSIGLINHGFDVVLVEPGKQGAFNAKKRGVKNVICATTYSAEFREGSLPSVGLFDVIEHIEDDVSFLRSIGDLMPEGGRLYATVPSYSFLWSHQDIGAGHFRRYTLSAITKVLDKAGFQVEFSTYIFRFLPLPILLFRTLPYRLGITQNRPRGSKIEKQAKTKKVSSNASRDHATEGGFAVSLLNSLLKREVANINTKRKMRFGGSCLVVAKHR